MRELIRRFRCWIGIHYWRQSRPIGLLDGFPPINENYKLPTRKCERCGKREEWLPGYGGSEWGCWIGIQEKNNVEN